MPKSSLDAHLGVRELTHADTGEVRWDVALVSTLTGRTLEWQPHTFSTRNEAEDAGRQRWGTLPVTEYPSGRLTSVHVGE